jgi:predicted PurR-regulated permease PerM
VQPRGPGGLQVFGVQLTPDKIAAELKAHVGAGLELGSSTRAGTAMVAVAVGVVLFAALSIYMILSGPEIVRGAVWMVPPPQRSTVKQLLPKMLTAVHRFYVGVLVIVVVTALASRLATA